MSDFTEREVRGYQSMLKAAVNHSQDGAYAEIDLATGRALIRICEELREILSGAKQ